MEFANTIISWFRENGRALPWRETKDPYAIWLSEIILQQTRIAQGWEYWERFMAQYPTVEDLAAASEDEVLKLWQGLGYYSRARNLHAAAKQIVALGKFPDTLEGIKSLKGVGDYTAAAIGSFAFDILAAVVDGNVYRVLSRYFGIDTPINSTKGKREFAALAQSLIPGGDSLDVSASIEAISPIGSSTPLYSSASLKASVSSEKIRPEAFEMELSPISAYNQGMMDFGAIQCTPQSPKCLLCPLAETCEALRSDRVSELPVKEKKLKVKTRHLTYIYIRCKGGRTLKGGSNAPMIAIHQRGEGDIWQGLWEPFNASIHEDRATTISEMTELLSLSNPQPLRLVARNVKHVLTHRVLLADFYLLETSECPKLPSDYLWIPEDSIDKYGVPRLIELLLEKIV